MRAKVVINSRVTRRERRLNRRRVIICATDKNDWGLIFKSCLEFKPPGNCPQWHQQEHRFEGVKAVAACKSPQGTALFRETLQMSQGGAWTASAYLNL